SKSRARTRQADFPRIPPAGRRDAVFLSPEAMLRGRSAALPAFRARGTPTAHARARSNPPAQPGALFPASLGHCRGGAAARDPGGGARLGGELPGHLLPGHLACLPAALCALLRAVRQWAALRLPRYRARYL